MSEHWLIVRRSRTVPGGFYVVRTRLTEDQARSWAAEYKRPHQAMSHAELMDRRLVALGHKEPGGKGRA